MQFKHISISEWRQFRSIEIDLHPQLTVLTGENGAGKTTILNLLSRHFGWGGELVSTPKKTSGLSRYVADYWRENYLEPRANDTDLVGEDYFDPIEIEPQHQIGPFKVIGGITYDNGAASTLNVPVEVGSTYTVGSSQMQPVMGLHIPSHRPLFSYRQVQTISTNARSKKELFEQYRMIIYQRYYQGHHQLTPNYFIKEALISLAIFGEGNSVVEHNSQATALFEAFQEALVRVLPKKLGFKRFTVRMPEVIMITESGEFALDAVSGGVASIIDITWQIFMYSTPDSPFVVTIDEPENHLHPELQRTFLPNLISAFPDVQFIVASHNPFVVTSVPDSNVYVLYYDDLKRVRSNQLGTVNRAGSSNEILRDVLGLEFTIPLWVESRLVEFIAEFESREITTESLQELRNRMKEIGLERYVPEAISRIIQKV